MKEMMKKLWMGVLIMGLFGLLSGCGKGGKTAVLTVWTQFSNTMTYVDPEGQDAGPETVPVRTNYTVKKGDEIENGLIRIDQVRNGAVTVSFSMEYAGNAYGPDGYSVRNYRPGKTFTFHKGEELSLTEYGLMDAEFRVNIIYVE